jgi:hypothetical protein
LYEENAENIHIGERFDVFTAVKIQVEVFWVVTPYGVVGGHQLFGGPTKRRHNPEELDVNIHLVCGCSSQHR